MSYQERLPHGPVVICDCCGAVGAIGDRDWRQARGAGLTHPVHLCHSCQRHAVWCDAHQAYHLPETLHRKPCITCGGLFTARVSLGIDHCPSCRRDFGVAVAASTIQPPHHDLLRELVSHFPWRGSRRH